MYGWRARIGMVIAASNTTMEPEFNRLKPDGVSVHVARVRVGSLSVEGAQTARQDLGKAVGDLALIGPSAIVYACTIANLAAGPDEDMDQTREIMDVTGVQTITAATAVIEAFHALKARRVVIATPYPDDADEMARRFFETFGFEVVAIGGSSELAGSRRPHNPLSARPVSHVGLQPPEFAYKLARSVYESSKGADALFISGANLRTQEAIAALEKDLHVPVLSSGSAAMWAALQVAGITEGIPGYGHLFSGDAPMLWKRALRPGREAGAAR